MQFYKGLKKPALFLYMNTYMSEKPDNPYPPHHLIGLFQIAGTPTRRPSAPPPALLPPFIRKRDLRPGADEAVRRVLPLQPALSSRGRLFCCGAVVLPGWWRRRDGHHALPRRLGVRGIKPVLFRSPDDDFHDGAQARV